MWKRYERQHPVSTRRSAVAERPRVVEILSSLIITHDHSNLHRWAMSKPCVVLSCIVSNITFNNGVTINCGLGVIQGNLKWHHSIDRLWVSIGIPRWLWPYLVSFPRWKRAIGQKSQCFFIPHLHLTPQLRWSAPVYCHEVRRGKTRMVDLRGDEKSLMLCLAVSKHWRVTDRRTDRHLATA